MKTIIKNYKNISNAILIDSGISGPTISIFGGIHGDEVSGIKANRYFYEQVKKGNINIKKGKLILVLEANEEAVKINDMQVNYNLNRLFKDDLVDKDDYEYKRVEELKSILKISDYLLDLHSTSGPSIPFLYSEMQNFDLAKKMGVSHVIGGWGDLDGNEISGDTENYINSYGGVGFTFEAGDHLSKDGFKNAYSMILNFLSALEIIDYKYFEKIGEIEMFFKIIDFYVAKSNDFKYKVLENNFQNFKAGTLIGIDSGEEVIANEDMIFVMPKKEEIIQKGVEVYFVGKEL